MEKVKKRRIVRSEKFINQIIRNKRKRRDEIDWIRFSLSFSFLNHNNLPVGIQKRKVKKDETGVCSS